MNRFVDIVALEISEAYTDTDTAVWVVSPKSLTYVRLCGRCVVR